MKILNILWGFGSGGIGKCFLTYNRLGESCEGINVHSVCIDIRNRTYDRTALHQNNIDIISISNPLDLSWISQLKKRIQTFRPDILFSHGFNGPVVGWVVKRVFKIQTPLVCSYHGAYHPPTKLKTILAPIYNYVQPWVYRSTAERVITVENQSRKVLISKGVPERKLTTVFNGIPEKNIQTNNNKHNDTAIKLLIASRLDKIKGIDYALKSLPEVLNKTSKPIKLYILGEGPENDNLRSITNKLGLKDVVCFLGYQDNVQEWLINTDIFLLPSLSECHSIGLLEAMQAGKAIVATRVGGNSESVRNGIDGLIVPPGNQQAIAEAILKLVSNPELRGQFEKNARQRFLDNFTESKMLTNLANVFKTIP